MELSEKEGGGKRARKATDTGTKPKVVVKAKKVKLAQATPDEAPMDGPIEKRSAAEMDFKVAEAAYYLAARRNFEPGHELDDWLEAERMAGVRG
jgi:Protein of unknown function (DUF2934)